MIRQIIFLSSLIFLLLTDQIHATIIVVVSTYDGFIVAADSRMTISTPSGKRIASDSNQKIFRIGHSSALTFSGAAFLFDLNNQKRNIGSLVENFKIKRKITDTTSISPANIAEDFKSFLELIYNKQKLNVKEGQLHIRIVGYDQDKNRRIFEIKLPNIEKVGIDSINVYGTIQELYPSGTPASLVQGQTDAWHRIVKGYDPKLLKMDLSQEFKDKLNNLRYDIRYDLMSMQDALDFAVFIVRATIEAQRFDQDAVMGVGGAIDVALVTPDGFRWIQNKKLNVEGKEFDY